MQINQFKISEKQGISVSMLKYNKATDENEPWSFSTKQEPLPALKTSFQGIKYFIPELIEVSEQWIESATIRTIHFKYRETGEIGCIITLIKQLHDVGRAITINTPLLYEGVNEEGTAELPDAMAEALRDLIKQIQGFVNGERLQTQMNFENAVNN